MNVSHAESNTEILPALKWVRSAITRELEVGKSPMGAVVPLVRGPTPIRIEILEA